MSLLLAVATLLSGLAGKPGCLVYSPVQAEDSYNDHFQVIWDDARRLYYAFWTQATREGAPDMRVVFSKSADRGRTWTAPRTLAGTPMGEKPRPRGVWQQPMLATTGRLYCLWNQQASAEALHHGLVYGRYSDDAGETWSEPEENKSIPRQFRDDPLGKQLPNWCIWQRPLRLGEGGRFLVGCTRHVKPADVQGRTDRTVGSWVEFWQYENIDENPAVKDVRISVLSGGRDALEIAVPGTDRFCCEEASIVKLPDGCLFALVRSRARHPFWSQSRDGGRSWTKPVPLKDAKGRAYLHPNSPCPMYDLKGCEAASGEYFALIHAAYDDSIPPLGRQVRGPLYLIRGRFDPTGGQPIAFGEPELFLPLKSDNSCYSSYTVVEGEGILWFGLRKHVLVGRNIGSAKTPLADSDVGFIDKSLCVVHRGWGLSMPENTMLAFERCWEAGFLPEADARVSTDGVLYAFHDPGYRGRPMSDRSWGEVQAIDVGAMKGPQWAGKGIKAPTWDEIFAALAKDPRREILMDHKDAPMDRLAERAKKYGVEKQAWWCAGDIESGAQWKRLVQGGKALAWVRFGRSWKPIDYADTARLAAIDDFVEKQVADWARKDFGGVDVVELIVNVNVRNPLQSAPSLPVVSNAVTRIKKSGRKSCVLIWAESADDLACYRSVCERCRPDCIGTDYPLRLREFLGEGAK